MQKKGVRDAANRERANIPMGDLWLSERHWRAAGGTPAAKTSSEPPSSAPATTAAPGETEPTASPSPLAVAALPAVAPLAAPTPRISTVRHLPCPLDATADDAGLLDQVVRYYARRLDEPGNAGRAYLAGRGLGDADFLRRFALGFADRSLGLRIPAKNRKEGAALRGRLESLGLFRSSGHEHFAGSIVVPIHGRDGAVVSLYGRKVSTALRAGTPDHLYLAGKHRGVWNWGPDLVDAEGRIVIAEALLDAASMWLAGLRSVTAAYGVHGWTDDHDAALREHQAKVAVIAFDADAAGDAGAATLATRLLAQGLTVFRVRWPSGLKDANAVLTAPEHGAESLRRVIAGAEWVGGSRPVNVPALPVVPMATAASSEGKHKASTALLPFAAGAAGVPENPATEATSPASTTPSAIPGVTVRRSGAGAGEELFVTIGTRTYRVRGWQHRRGLESLTVALRVAVATAQGERLHHDRLDLYQTRQRTAFVSAAAEECGLAAAVLKADLGTLILVIEAAELAEARRSAAAATAGPSDPAAALTAAERAEALEFLRAPDLCARIVADLGRCGLVGEDVNKLVAYLAASSRKLDQPVAVVVQSSSAAGKSTLMDRVLALMPPEDVRQYSAISGKSPFYLGTANLKHKILAIAEEEGARNATYALKLLQSDGFLAMAATGKDPESGKLVTHDYRVEGPVMLMLTTTAIDVDPELLNRCLVLTVDESMAQTAAIQVAQRTARTLDGMAARRERSAIEARHRNAQRLLRPVAVVNPHAPGLAFAAVQTRLRRDHAKYLALIDAVAFLHQHQRLIRTHEFPDGTTLDYVTVTPEDIALANRLAGTVLARALDDLPPQTRRVLLALHGWIAATAAGAATPLDQVTFTRRQAREALHLGPTQARLHLDRLRALEYVEALRPQGDGVTQWYRLAWVPPAAATPAADDLGLVVVAATPATAPITNTATNTPTTSTCRYFGGPGGASSALPPTGATPDFHAETDDETPTCRTNGTHVVGAYQNGHHAVAVAPGLALAVLVADAG